MNQQKTRIEEDLLGRFKVAKDALYGIQTQRAIQNFSLNRAKTIGDYPEFIKAILLVKKSCAVTNKELKYLDNKKSTAIIKAVDFILNKKIFDQFPIHFLHGGSCTSANMNVNEVIVNIAEEFLGGKRGQYKLIHPNDHVNLHQSTNDVIPTACHIAIIDKWKKSEIVFKNLANTLYKKGREYRKQKRLSRTHLQDALVTSFQELFDTYGVLVDRTSKRVSMAVKELYQINLGGTAVGKKSDVPKDYFNKVIINLKETTQDRNYITNKNLFDATQNVDGMIIFSANLDILARSLIKMAKDLRLLSSGPEAGFGEIILKPLQPGSSIMPGKVNPVILEFVIQLCLQVCGYNSACKVAIDHGELELNTWKGLIVFNILDSIDLLTNAVLSLDEKCIESIKINIQKNKEYTNTLIAQLTELMKAHGYSKVSNLCKETGGDIERIKKMIKK